MGREKRGELVLDLFWGFFVSVRHGLCSHSILSRWSLLIYKGHDYFIVLGACFFRIRLKSLRIHLQSELKIEYCTLCLSLTLLIGVASDKV